ncbi:MAG TPA: S8 family serine peptidase [Thermoanaerobaculia bacterium]|nr:S8 family serine peptidase [Thermoanaerobaculia bacterium]
MTRLRAVLGVVLLQALALPAAAQTGLRDGRIVPSPFAAPGDASTVIVEFRDVPLFAAPRAAAKTSEAAQRLVQFESDLARLAGASAKSGDVPRITQRYSRLFSGAAVTASADVIDRIAKLDYVRAIHADRAMHASLDDSLAKIHAPDVWSAFGTRGEGVVVAIIDSGIDYNHPAFGGGFGAGHRVAGGWDFVNNDADPMDDAGHGTHVAGIVGGNGGGVTGIAPGVTFLAYKVLDSNGNGTESNILAGMERAADPNGDGDSSDHAGVVNMSLGGAALPDDPLVEAVETGSAAGLVFCIAAGNSSDFWTVSSPGDAPSAITVGATTLDDEIASFSSKGPDPVMMAIKPEVVAPGVDIVSAKAGGGLLSASGTSMATPHVAGVAALLRAIHRDWSVADIKAAIVETAVVLGNDVMAEGAGRVDALRAATADVVVSPSTLNLGRDNLSAASWTNTRTVTLTNRGTTSRTIVLGAASPRSDIATSTDATSFTLAPGASRDVHLEIDVDNTRIPSPTEGSLAYSGTVTITGGAIPIHVPWAFVKAALVTIDYDGDEPYEGFVASTHSLAFGHVVGDIGQHTTTAAVPAGEYDIKVQTFPERFATDHRIFLIEQQKVDDTATISLHRDAAAFEIVPSPADAAGRPMVQSISGGSSCLDALVMMWPPNSALAMSAVEKSRSEQFLLSPVSSRFTLLPFQYCYGAHEAFSAQLTPLQGISSSVTSTVDPSLWTRVPVRATSPDGAQTLSADLSPGFTWRGSNWVFALTIGARGLPSSSPFEGTVYLTREQHPSVSAAVQLIVEGNASQDSPLPVPPEETLTSGYIRSTADGVVLWPFLTTSPATYIAAPGETLSFGEGPPVAKSSIWMEGSDLLAGAGFVGPLDEEGAAESAGVTSELRDASGSVVQSPLNLLAGAYTFSATKSLAGGGDARLTASFDTRLEDGAPPALTAMRLLDASGRVASRLAANTPATIFFSAIDRKALPESVQLRLVRANATVVRWRIHGATQWNAVPLTIGASEVANGQDGFDALGHVPAGTIFRGDLSAATSSGASAIDLELHVEDDSGNTLDYTIEPAFSVASRRRAVH